MEQLKNELIDYRKGDCQGIIKTLPDESIDVILTDPPYLYLKGQKLEREFDENYFFSECKRVLKKDGFIVLFGRGTSFYRWNTILADLGFSFKEEIVWDKRRVSSPVTSIGRVHEMIVIYSKGKGKINNVKIPYGQIKAFNLEKVYEDIKRLGGLFNKEKAYNRVVEDLKKYNNNESYGNKIKTHGYKHTVSSDMPNGNVSTYTLIALEEGLREQSIITCNDSHYSNIHPTQKPVEMLKRLLNLVLPSYERKSNYNGKPLVADFFGGSGSTGEACIELDVPFFGCEIDDEYFRLSKSRLENAYRNRDRQVSLF